MIDHFALCIIRKTYKYANNSLFIPKPSLHSLQKSFFEAKFRGAKWLLMKNQR